MGQYADRLAQGEQTFQNAPDQPDEVPAGTYNLQLQDASIEEFGDPPNSRLFVAWEHYISEGEEAGQTVRDISALEPNSEGTPRANQFALGQTRKRMQKMCEGAGITYPEDPRDTEEAIAAIREAAPAYVGKVTHSTSKKTGRTFTNVEIVQFVGSGGKTRPAPRTATKTEAPAQDAPYPVGTSVTFDDGGGGDVTAKVVEIDGDDLLVREESGERWKIKADEVRPPRAEAPADDGADDDHVSLLELAQNISVDVSDQDDLAAVVDALNDAGPLDPKELELNDDEVGLCKRNGVLLKVPAKPKPKRRAKAKAKPKRATKKR